MVALFKERTSDEYALTFLQKMISMHNLHACSSPFNLAMASIEHSP
jgi:hypothetical protein